jgi:citrate lyase beta subunit
VGAAAIDGAMVDAPVFLRAEQILRRATRFRPPAA